MIAERLRAEGPVVLGLESHASRQDWRFFCCSRYLGIKDPQKYDCCMNLLITRAEAKNQEHRECLQLSPLQSRENSWSEKYK